MKNILISSVGRRVSLLQSFEKEAQELDLGIHIIPADMFPELAPACNIARHKPVRTPGVGHKGYIENMIQIVKDNNIGLWIPTIDTELEILATNINVFSAIGCDIVISSNEFVKICTDKRKTKELFTNISLDTIVEYIPGEFKFPLFIKPCDGSRSQNTCVVRCEEEMTDICLTNPKNIFQEYLDPNEYYEITVDAYYDKNYNLKCVIPRKRIEIRDGEVSKGLTVRPSYYDRIVESLRNIKGARGCINIQFFVNKSSETRILASEINPRFGGGFPLSYYAGGNYPRWIISEYILDKEIEYFDTWKSNLLMLRYDEAVFVNDFKD